MTKRRRRGLSNPMIRAAIAQLSRFQPSDIPILVNWHDYLDTVTLYQDSGLTTPATVSGVVGGWKDKHSHAYHLLQATTTNKPTLTADGVLFDGIDNYLRATFGATYAQPREAIVVGKFVNAASNPGYMLGAVNTSFRGEFGVNGGFYIALGSALMTSNIASNTNNHIFKIRFNGAASSIAVDGGTPYVGNVGTQSVTGLTLGCRFDLAAWGSVLIKGYMSFDGILSSDEYANVLAYAHERWGV